MITISDVNIKFMFAFVVMAMLSLLLRFVLHVLLLLPLLLRLPPYAYHGPQP